MFHELPSFATLLDRLSSIGRLILFDRRGVGASDPITPDNPGTPDDLADDLAAVLDAAASRQHALIAPSLMAPAAITYASRQPTGLSHLALFNASASMMRRSDYPLGLTGDQASILVSTILDGAGPDGPTSMELLVPTGADNTLFERWADRGGRMGASRGSAAAIYDAIRHIDVRHLLPIITTPTLVMHRADMQITTIDHGRYLADYIPNARFVELDGSDGPIFMGETATVLDEIERFITGTTSVGEHRELASLIFTDIVDSTGVAAEVGDRRWRELLDSNEAAARAVLERHEGSFHNSTGDGMLCSFDLPSDAVLAAFECIDAAASLGLDLRVGIHCGEVERRGDDLGGIAVNLCARITDLATAGQVLVSGAIPALTIGAGLFFDEPSHHQLRGIPGRWPIHAARRHSQRNYTDNQTPPTTEQEPKA